MAETYGIYDWRALPLITAATLAQGLPAHSRVMRAVSGSQLPNAETTLLAIIADRIGHLIWMFSDDGSKGKNHPPSLLAALSGQKESEAEGYDTAEDFMAAWAAIAGGDNDA